MEFDVQVVGVDAPGCEIVSPPQTVLVTHTASVVDVAAVTWYCELVLCVVAAHTVSSSPIGGATWN